MYRLAWQKARLAVLGLLALGVVPAVWAGNGCRDTIRPTCSAHEWRRIKCCQIMSDRLMFGDCYCQRFTDRQGFNYFRGGIDSTGPSCEQQNDICC